MAQNGRISYEMYNTYSNVLRQALQLAEQNFFKNRFKVFHKNPKKSWSLVNSLMGRTSSKSITQLVINGSLTSDSGTVATAFAQYFQSVPQIIKAEILKPNIDLLSFIPNSMFLNETNSVEVLNVITKLKRTNEQFDLSVVVLKEGAQFFLDLLQKYLIKVFMSAVTRHS